MLGPAFESVVRSRSVHFDWGLDLPDPRMQYAVLYLEYLSSHQSCVNSVLGSEPADVAILEFFCLDLGPGSSDFKGQ